MTTLKTWLASAALVGGAGAGVAAGLTTTSTDQQAAAAQPPVAGVPDATYLQQQIDVLLQEDRALNEALRRARARLSGQVRAGERSLAALQHRILAAQVELARAQAARAQMPSAVATAPTTRAPASHATTGASGASPHAGDDQREGSNDG